MRELDKTKVYDLSELTIEELNEIANYMHNNHGWEYQVPHTDLFWNEVSGTWLYNKKEKVNNMVNAKELFYTLENIQVDCRKLSEGQIQDMAGVFKKDGYRIGSLYLNIEHCFIRKNVGKYCLVTTKQENKTTITYDKFMELFGRKEENFKKLIEVLNEELTEEAYKKTEYEVKYIAEKPTHPSIAILDKAIELSNELKAYKETANKLNYELDFNFITQLAERMAQNKHKYDPYNWQKLDNIDELKQALFRHVLEVMKGNYEDDNRLFGHLESISLNCMFINYQLNNLKTK